MVKNKAVCLTPSWQQIFWKECLCCGSLFNERGNISKLFERIAYDIGNFSALVFPVRLFLPYFSPVSSFTPPSVFCFLRWIDFSAVEWRLCSGIVSSLRNGRYWNSLNRQKWKVLHVNSRQFWVLIFLVGRQSRCFMCRVSLLLFS